VAIVCRKRWHEPVLPISLAAMYLRTRSVIQTSESRSPRVVRKSAPSLSAVERGPCLVEVLHHPGQCSLANGHNAILLSLALAHHDRHALAVEVVELQGNELAAPHARRVQDLEDRAVTEPDGIADVRESKHALDFGDGEHVLRQPLLAAWQLEVGGRVREDHILAREPAEEAAHRHEAHALRSEGEGPAVVLPVMEEEALIAFKDRPGHILRTCDVPLVAPRMKSPIALSAFATVRAE
jgi:hypothetical protein